MKSQPYPAGWRKILLAITGCAGLMASGSMGMAQAVCSRIEVRAAVEITGNELSLADFLAPGSCPALAQAAARVRLGSAPRGGSVRVIAGKEVRVHFEQLARNGLPRNELSRDGLSRNEDRPQIGQDAITVPERITVRRAGARASCAELASKILLAAEAPGTPSSPGSNSPMPNLARSSFPRSNLPGSSGGPRSVAGSADESVGQSTDQIECGSIGTVPSGAAIELMRTSWDPAHGRWEALARCRRAEDCVPFFIRWPGDQAQHAPNTIAGKALLHAVASQGITSPLVRPGQKATLLWEQDGIRVVVSAVSLDRGEAGDSVRVRIALGGRVLHAIVVSAGLLRMTS